MINRMALRGIVERSISVMIWALVFICSFMFNSTQIVHSQTCATIDYNITTIAAEYAHTVGVKDNGTVVAVGWNGFGQLNISSWINIKAIAAGFTHTIGLREDGTVVAVGYNGQGQLNVESWVDIKAIAAGWNHTVGLREDGTVVAVGYNENGQTNVSSWTNIKAIAANVHYTIGLREDGTVIAVGNNGYGQLSDFSSWANIKAIAAGLNHTVGLKENGTVVAVGYNEQGQLNVESWANIKAIAAGWNHTVGLKENGTVVAVGNSYYGQINVSEWTNIKAIAAGQYYTVGLKEDGTVVAVGYNGYGVTNVSDWANIKQPTCLDSISTPDISNSTSTIDFGEVQISNSSSQTITISNIGNAELIINGMNITGGDASEFSKTANCSTVAPDASCTVTVSITPTSLGVKSAALSISSNDHDTPTVDIPLTGIGVDTIPPQVTITTSSNILWPPNHKMADVVIGGSASDNGSGVESVVITVADEYGVYNMTVPGFGSAIQLEAWREGTDMDGRHYTITAVVTDRAGNQSTATTEAHVPHDMR